MPRKAVYSREMVLDAAVEVFKQEGYEQITVKKVAKYLGSSIAPVYAAYTSMEDLKRDVILRIEESIDFSLEEQEKTFSEEQRGFFQRMFQAIDPDNQELPKKLEELICTILHKTENQEKSRFYLFHVFNQALSLMSGSKTCKLSRREILSLIARHKKYILSLRKKKLQGKKRTR